MIKTHDAILPIEIKSAETLHPEFIKGLIYFNKITNTEHQGYIVYAGNDPIMNLKGYRVFNYKDLNVLLSEFAIN